MLSAVAQWFRNRYSPLRGAACECCNHNFEVWSREGNKCEPQRCEKLLKGWMRYLKRAQRELTARPREGRRQKGGKRRRLERILCLWKIMGREKRSASFEPVIAQSETVKRASSGSPKPHIHHALASIFTSILESDVTIHTQPNPPMVCFLAHLARDHDTTAPFLSRLSTLPRSATQLDEFASLSFASSWLQASLVRIRDSLTSSSAELELQMPFVLVETDLQCAGARAAVLQERFLDERVVITTLDLVALREASRVVSARHAFKMLRVPVADVEFEEKLLVWADNERGKGGGVLRDAVLAVMDCNEEKGGDKAKGMARIGDCNGAKSMGSESEQSGSEKPQRKKESVVTNYASLARLRVESYAGDWAAVDGGRISRSDTCWF